MVKRDVSIGLFVGLAANAIGLLLATLLLGHGQRFTTALAGAIDHKFLGKLISLGAVLNLVPFFIFIRKRQDYRAKGVLLITLCAAIATLLVKLL